MQALQSGQITPAQFEEFKRNMQGLLGGGQMGQSPATGYPAQADTGWQPPKMPPQRPVDPMIGEQIGQAPQVDNRGVDTPQERDFLEQFVENYDKNGVMSRGVDTPNERDFLQNIMQDYNKRY